MLELCFEYGTIVTIIKPRSVFAPALVRLGLGFEVF